MRTPWHTYYNTDYINLRSTHYKLITGFHGVGPSDDPMRKYWLISMKGSAYKDIIAMSAAKVSLSK